MNSIQCPNPECRADNPAGAKFCRKCGTAFTPTNRYKQMVKSYFNKIWLKSPLKCRALFINVPRYLLAIKDNISQKSEYVQHIKENVLDADLVVWDEVGTKGLTQFEHENILNIIKGLK